MGAGGGMGAVGVDWYWGGALAAAGAEGMAGGAVATTGGAVAAVACTGAWCMSMGGGALGAGAATGSGAAAVCAAAPLFFFFAFLLGAVAEAAGAAAGAGIAGAADSGAAAAGSGEVEGGRSSFLTARRASSACASASSCLSRINCTPLLTSRSALSKPFSRSFTVSSRTDSTSRKSATAWLMLSVRDSSVSNRRVISSIMSSSFGTSRFINFSMACSTDVVSRDASFLIGSPFSDEETAPILAADPLPKLLPLLCGAS